MRKLTKKWQMLLYAMGGMGVNMLNLMVGSYLCSAIIATGFDEKVIGNQTFLGIDLVVPLGWAIFGIFAKVIDGLIDIPMASFTDNLKTRFGRRRPALIIGLIPMILAYVLFTLVTPNPQGATWLNTAFYGVALCVFYSFYTLTMVTYYATFTEIVETQEERNFISNVKSVCDIVYFILGYVLVAMLLKGMNIRLVSMIVLPIVLTMLIPLFLIKERSTLDGVIVYDNGRVSKTVNIGKSIGYTFKNKKYIIWMLVYSFMTFGVQLFLSGINEYFSVAGMNMMFVMMAAFAPVPFTLMLYNRLTWRHGFGFSYRYILIIFAIGMLAMFGVSLVPADVPKEAIKWEISENKFITLLPAGSLKPILAIVTGLISSFGIGAMFSVAYSVPSQLAAEEEEKTGVSHSAMYFAIQGLFAGIAAGLGGGVVLTLLKTQKIVRYMTPICALGVLVAFVLSFLLPKSVCDMGKQEKKSKKN